MLRFRKTLVAAGLAIGMLAISAPASGLLAPVHHAIVYHPATTKGPL